MLEPVVFTLFQIECHFERRMIDSFVSRVSSTKGHYLAKKFKEFSSLPCLDYQFFQTIHKSKMNFLVVYFNLLN